MTVDLEQEAKNAKYIDLEHLSGAMIKLSAVFGVDYTQLVNISSEKVPTKYMIPTKFGEIFVEGIFKSESIGVARGYAKKDSYMDPHIHPEWEILYVESGEVWIKIDGAVQKYKEKQLVVFSPGAEHDSYYPVDSVILAITIPASSSWPDPKN